MANGRTHDSITFWLAIPLAIATALISHDLPLTVMLVGAFLFSGLMFGPDLDTRSLPFKRWGPLRFLWEPYRQRINHRSPWSHGPIRGTLGRIVYLTVVIVLLMLVGLMLSLLLGLAIAYFHEGLTADQVIGFYQRGVHLGVRHGPGVARSIVVPWRSLLLIFVYLELGAASHYITDHLWSAWKQARRPKRKRNRNRRRRRS